MIAPLPALVGKRGESIMKTLTKAAWPILLLASALVWASCAGKGQYDPATKSYDTNAPASTIVVGAESFRDIALNTFDGLMTIEREHEAALKALNPQIHVFTEKVRRESKGWLDSLTAAKTAYQSARTPENGAKLQAAVSLLDSMLGSAAKYLAQAATVKEAK